MDLVLLIDTEGQRRKVAECPPSLLSSRAGLENFLRLHATRQFGPKGSGIQGRRNWRIVEQIRCLVPLYVSGPNGQCLVVE